MSCCSHFLRHEKTFHLINFTESRLLFKSVKRRNERVQLKKLTAELKCLLYLLAAINFAFLWESSEHELTLSAFVASSKAAKHGQMCYIMTTLAEQRALHWI
jgi:hypothetical protein